MSDKMIQDLWPFFTGILQRRHSTFFDNYHLLYNYFTRRNSQSGWLTIRQKCGCTERSHREISLYIPHELQPVTFKKLSTNVEWCNVDVRDNDGISAMSTTNVRTFRERLWKGRIRWKTPCHLHYEFFISRRRVSETLTHIQRFESLQPSVHQLLVSSG